MRCTTCEDRGYVWAPDGHDPYPDKPREQFKCPENCERSQMIDRSRAKLGNPERRMPRG